MKKCNLCKINEANKKNSHIIPKFLGKPLFQNTKPRHTLGVNNKGAKRKIQDIPKEDFILCKNCEKKFEIIETYFSKKIELINNYSNRKDIFEVINFGSNRVLHCLNLDHNLFKLFWYSVIWRVSISSHQYFKNFELPNDIENELRIFLNTNLNEIHTDFIQNLVKIKSFPKYHIIAFKPDSQKREIIGLLTAFRMSPDHFGIFTSDTILFFYLNNKKLDHTLHLMSNKYESTVKLVLTNSKQWKEINSNVIRHRLLKKSS